MDAAQAWEPGKMTLATVVDAQVVANNGVSFTAKSFAAEVLGPMPGKWNGYDQLATDLQKEVWGKVGYIHAISAEAGRNIVTIGQALCDMKEMLPHGQFMDCVKAEFGWNRAWAGQLMDVAKRFSNVHSSIHLPSSAKVLALLAQSDADDDIVQQAAEEKWTVKETRKRLGSERQRDRTIVDEAMSVLKLSPEARRLAEQAEHITTRQLMDELGLDDVPKGKRHQGESHVFCKNGTGWWKLPFAQPLDVQTIAHQPSERLRCANESSEVLPLAVAAQRLGKKLSYLRNRLSPSTIAKHGYVSGNGWQAEPHSIRGACLVRSVSDESS
jgi:hypothetical protein